MFIKLFALKNFKIINHQDVSRAFNILHSKNKVSRHCSGRQKRPSISEKKVTQKRGHTETEQMVVIAIDFKKRNEISIAYVKLNFVHEHFLIFEKINFVTKITSIAHLPYCPPPVPFRPPFFLGGGGLVLAGP